MKRRGLSLPRWAWEWCAHWAFNARDKHAPGSPEWRKADRWVARVFSW